MSEQKREKLTATTTLFNISELKAEVNRMSQHLAAHPIYQLTFHGISESPFR